VVVDQAVVVSAMAMESLGQSAGTLEQRTELTGADEVAEGKRG